MKLTFEQWFDIFVEHCRKKLNYHGPIDQETFESDWIKGFDPEQAAREFVAEMNEG